MPLEIDLLYKSAVGGLAAVGFAILFNVPKRTLINIYLMGAFAVFLKFLSMHFGVHIVIASFIGALSAGINSKFAAHNKKSPPPIFSIPAVIPMVPGIFTYRMMLGLVKLTSPLDDAIFQEALHQTISNGLNAGFIIMALSIGVSAPNLLLRKESFHNVIKLKTPKQHSKALLKKVLKRSKNHR